MAVGRTRYEPLCWTVDRRIAKFKLAESTRLPVRGYLVLHHDQHHDSTRSCYYQSAQ